MYLNTLEHLFCPRCEADLTCAAAPSSGDIQAGEVICKSCKAVYPILAGVLILVPDVSSYLLEHAKGIAREVSDDQIPKQYRATFSKARRQLARLAAQEHIEEDLESERVTSLYVMGHYLTSREILSASRAIDSVVKQYWDRGPFAAIKEGIEQLRIKGSLLELGCGVGGLLPFLARAGAVTTYLGLDSSFASIALARHLALGAPLNTRLRAPEDLLYGPVSRELKIEAAVSSRNFDFIACDLAHPPVKKKRWDMTAALNVIDMLPEPVALPVLQYEVLRPGGTAIQSCPYIWHAQVAAELREAAPKGAASSDSVVLSLYQRSGFKVVREVNDVPWIFFKNIRQIELYSVHLFFASRCP